MHRGVYGIEAVKLFNTSKIILNFHANRGYGPNMRVFEATGSGGFLITDDAEDVKDFFRINREVAVFNDEKELLSQIGYYLDKEEERIDIAYSGYTECHAEHTYEKRLKYMLDTVK